MRTSAQQTLSVALRISVLMLVLAGPLCAMAVSQDRSFGDEGNAIGLVLIKSIQGSAA